MTMREAFRQVGIQVPNESVSENMTTGEKTCNNCGETFIPRQSFHTLCDNCHRQQRGSGPQSGRQNRQQGSRGHVRGGALPQFPDSYFAKDNKDQLYLLPDFVSKEKVDILAQRLANDQNRLTTGQARRFFNHCRDVERRLNFGESWERVSASFESLSAHAQNANSARKIPYDFQRFIDDNVIRVTSADDQRKAFLDGFLPHFEALIGYGSAHMKDR